MTTKPDLFGAPVGVGDVVAINPPSYKGLTRATVVKLTPKGFTVQYKRWAITPDETMEITNVSTVVKSSVDNARTT